MTMNTRKILSAGLFSLPMLLLPPAAEAQSYRCTGTDGKKYYGSTVPPQCAGQPVEQMSPQGLVLRRSDPHASENERAAKEAAVKQKREEDTVAKEERRRNNALLATYTSEKDIEDARERAIADNTKASKEMEFYSDAPKTDKAGKGRPAAAAKTGAKPPPKLLEDIHSAELDLKAQENLLAMRQKEGETINAKYDEDKKRFVELTKPRK
jgi:hypothetical protein